MAWNPSGIGFVGIWCSGLILALRCIGLTRCGWNFSVVFYGIIPSNLLAYPGGVR
jgi:hypothetical protein